ncbi:MAG: hypothetical protein ACKVPX_04300 [Myxococcaceae bacterium]
MRRVSAISLSALLFACSRATPAPGVGLTDSVQITQLPMGDSHCPQGGVRLDTPDESGYVCNGAGGAGGRDGILSKSFLPFTNGASLPMNGEWFELPGSSFTANTSGGTLEVFMDITAHIGSVSAQFACRPLVDGEWMGVRAGISNGRRAEGVVELSPGVHFMWSKTRLYRGIPSGAHRFSIECYGAPNDEDEVSVCGFTESTCAWGFIEMAP